VTPIHFFLPRDSGHEEHDELVEWIGGKFDSEAFDLEDANEALWYFR
jgi:hypothetical protein